MQIDEQQHNCYTALRRGSLSASYKMSKQMTKNSGSKRPASEY